MTPPIYTPKLGESPTQWLFDMELYFACARVREKNKVVHGVMRLRGAAESWWRYHTQRTSDGQGRPTAERVTVWTDFASDLCEQFTRVSERKVRWCKSYDLNRTLVIQVYKAFRELMFQLQVVTKLECTLYESGPQMVVQVEIHMQFPRTSRRRSRASRGTTGPRWDRPLTRAVQSGPLGSTSLLGGQEWDMSNHVTPVSSSHRSGLSSRCTGRAREIPARLNATEVKIRSDLSETAMTAVGQTAKAAVGPLRMQDRGGPRGRRTTKAEKQRLRREGRCFCCGRTGHMIRDCVQITGIEVGRSSTYWRAQPHLGSQPL